jgi:prepilin-type processing-associated H-X9-DG protein
MGRATTCVASEAQRCCGRNRSAPASLLRSAFTLTEVLIILGLIAVLISLFLPVVARARAAAQQAGCLSNLRQMGLAWSIYLTDNRGRLPAYSFNSPSTPEDTERNPNWLNILDSYKVRGQTLLCPAANEPIPYAQANTGYGNVNYAWTGAFESVGGMSRVNMGLIQTSSYGYNKYLTAAGGFGREIGATQITSARRTASAPVFFDCIAMDAKPPNALTSLPPPPPNLRGDGVLLGQAPDHWKFLIARHGRGINAFFIDGSARWITLEDTYQLTWKYDWVRCRLALPLY